MAGEKREELRNDGAKTGKNPKNGRFEKGNTFGNGRKKLPPELNKLALDACPAAWEYVAGAIVDECQKPEIRYKCSELVIAYAMGKPRQSMDLNAENVPPVIFIGGDSIPD